MMHKKGIKILDCTFRDGGYYTNWNFSYEFCQTYLKLVNTGVADIVEIGLRTINSNNYLGPYAYSAIDFFEICNKYTNVQYSVLVNWFDIKDSFEAFKSLFPGVRLDFVDIVRIVVKSINLKDIDKYVLYLKEKEYQVCLNIQKCDHLINEDENLFKKKINVISPDVLYLADTNGCLDSNQTRFLVEKFKNILEVPIGVHMHNNQGLAYSNTLESINAGATYLDSTFSGIGRGPGNTQTEYLSCFLRNLNKQQILEIVDIIENFFCPLKKKFLWGENYYYFLSGLNNQSASLMHNLMNNKVYPKKSLIELSTSSEDASISSIAKEFNTERIFTIKKPNAAVIANGKSWQIEKKEIINFLKENKIKTIHLNYPNDVSIISEIDSFCSCDPIKIINDFDNYTLSKNTPLICPKNILDNVEIDKEKINRINYDCFISSDKFEIKSQSCTIPFIQSLCYCIAFLYSKGFKNILLIGVQGFNLSTQNVEIINCINQLNIRYPDLELTSANPNCLGIKSKSIFEIRNIK